MKPRINIDSERSMVTVKLEEDMSLAEVREFLEELKAVVGKFNEGGVPFSMLIDAESKTFEDLNAVRELSQGLRGTLKTCSIKRYAVYRPQNAYLNDDEITQTENIKNFLTLDDARTWLLQAD